MSAEIGDRVRNGAENAVRNASGWLVWLGRFGYIAKGVVYFLVGVLAAYSAVSVSAVQEGTKSAFQYIATLPLGQFLLGAVAVGLVGHAVWRFVQAFMDTENKGTDAKGIIARGAYAIIGLIYLGLAFSAAGVIIGSRETGTGSEQSWTAWLMAQPFGPWLVGIVGGIVFAVGVYQFYRAYTAEFREKLHLEDMSDTEETWATRLGRFGFAARGVVFFIIGLFLAVAAYRTDPGATRGLGGALRAIEQQPFGPWLLAVVAAGFAAYGLFMFVLAKYRRMVIT